MSKLNITYISSSIIPSRTANSVHVMKMSQALAGTGYNVTLIAAKDKRYTENNILDSYEFYGVKKQFDIYIIEKIGIPIIRSFTYSYTAHKHALKNNSDIVYCRDLKSGYLMAKKGHSVVYECHSPSFGVLNEILFKKLIANQNCLAVVVISEALKRTLVKEYNINTEKVNIIVAHDGVDIENFDEGISQNEARQSLDLGEGVIIGYTGHLYEGRGIDIILELAKINKKYTFMVVGGNKVDIEKYEEKSRELNINNIIFYGHVANSKLYKYWRACDILLMPYQRKVSVGKSKMNTVDYMSPLKMFEYLASGVPFISSDLPVLREVLENNYNCLLVECDMVVEWNKAVEELVRSSEKGAFIAKNASLTSKKYTWDKRVELLFKQILKEN